MSHEPDSLARSLELAHLELCWGTVERASLLEMIGVAGKNGFSSVTVSVGQYREAREAGISDCKLRAALTAADVRVEYVDALGTALPGMPPPREDEKMIRWLYDASEEEVCGIAEALGSPAVNVAHRRGNALPAETLAEALGQLARRAADRGLTLLIEFHPLGGIPDLATARQLIELAGESNVEILVDTVHHARSGGGLADVVDAGRLVGGLQLADRAADDGPPFPPLGSRLMPGDGILPLRDIVAAVRAARPDVPIGIEVFGEELRSMPFDAAAAAAARAVRGLM